MPLYPRASIKRLWTNRPFFRPMVITAVAGAALAGCDRPSTQFMSMGTGGTGGVYYVLGGALVTRLNQRDPQRQYTAEVTGASVENVNRIREGQLDFGVALSVSAYEAFNGGMDYPEPVRSLRVVAPLYPNLTHIVVSRSAEIDSLPDLRGKRVSVGSPGAGTEQISRQLLEAVGLDYQDIDARFLSFSESAAALQDGAIDAAIISVGYPASAVLEATTTAGARLIPIPAHVIATLREKYPYHSPGEIPAGVYRGVSEPVSTVSTMNWIVAREDLAADVVDHILDVLTEDREELIQVHEMARQIDLANLSDAPIPLHRETQAWLDRNVP